MIRGVVSGGLGPSRVGPALSRTIAARRGKAGTTIAPRTCANGSRALPANRHAFLDSVDFWTLQNPEQASSPAGDSHV